MLESVNHKMEGEEASQSSQHVQTGKRLAVMDKKAKAFPPGLKTQQRMRATLCVCVCLKGGGLDDPLYAQNSLKSPLNEDLECSDTARGVLSLHCNHTSQQPTSQYNNTEMWFRVLQHKCANNVLTNRAVSEKLLSDTETFDHRNTCMTVVT